ncbi:MAG: Mur ligase family protein [Vicinamibacterales bacterium]
MLVGGIARNLGEGGSSYRMGQGRDFVIEGDEYDSAFFDKTAKFLKYLPDIAVINNIEFNHADIYADLDAVTTAFARLVRLVPRRGLLLVGADSPVAASAESSVRCQSARRSARRRISTGRRTTCTRARSRRGFTCGGMAHRSARSRCRSSANTTCGTRSRRSPWRQRSASTRFVSPTNCGRLRASSGGSRWSVS